MSRSWSKGFKEGNAIYQLNMLASVTVDSVDHRFIELTGFDIRTIRVLRLVGDAPGITFAEITSRAALEKSLTSRIIQNLVRSGQIDRRNDPKDARRFGLHITEAGLKVRKRADRLTEAGLELLFQVLEPAEISAFKTTMGKLADWIDTDEFEIKADKMFDGISFDDE